MRALLHAAVAAAHQRYTHIGIQSSAELGEYYRQYLLITRYLIARNSISAIEQSWYFF